MSTKNKISYFFLFLCSFGFSFLFFSYLLKQPSHYQKEQAYLIKTKLFSSGLTNWQEGRNKLKYISQTFNFYPEDDQENLFTLFSYLEAWKIFSLSNVSSNIQSLWIEMNEFLKNNGFVPENSGNDFIDSLDPSLRSNLENKIQQILHFTLLELITQNKYWTQIKKSTPQQKAMERLILPNQKIVDLTKIPLTFTSEIENDLSEELAKFYDLELKNGSLAETINNLLEEGWNYWSLWLKKYNVFQNYFPKLNIIKMSEINLVDNYKPWKIDLTHQKPEEITKFFEANHQVLSLWTAKKWKEYLDVIINQKFKVIEKLFFQFIPKFQILGINDFNADGKNLSIVKLNETIADPSFLKILKTKGLVFLPLEAMQELMEWASLSLIFKTKTLEAALKKVLDDKFANKWKILQKYLDILNILYIESMPISNFDDDSLSNKNNFVLSHLFLFSDRELYDLNRGVFQELKKIDASDDEAMREWLQNSINQRILSEWKQVRAAFESLQKEKKEILDEIYNINNESIYLSNLFQKRHKKEAYELNVEDIEELKKLQGLSTKQMKDLFSGSFAWPKTDKKSLTEGLYHFLIPILTLTFLFIFLSALFLNRAKKHTKFS